MTADASPGSSDRPSGTQWNRKDIAWMTTGSAPTGGVVPSASGPEGPPSVVSFVAIGNARRGSWCGEGVMKLGGPPRLRVRLFGRVRIDRGGDEISLPTRKATLLLAYLLLHPGTRSRERIAALFWGDSLDSSAQR